MIVVTTTSPTLYMISNSFRAIIPSNIFMERLKVWNGKIHQTKSIKLKRNFWRTILFSGLLVGSLDITAALVQFYIKTGKDPLIVLKYIASAVFGKDAYAGGNKMAIYGLLFHFIIAFL